LKTEHIGMGIRFSISHIENYFPTRLIPSGDFFCYLFKTFQVQEIQYYFYIFIKLFQGINDVVVYSSSMFINYYIVSKIVV
jgi:hypothetical protein